MSEHKSHRIKIENLPKGKTMCSVGNKNFSTLVIVWVFALGVLYFTKDTVATIPFILYGLIVSLRPYKGIFDGYNSFFVIYLKDNKEECDIYYLSELKYWCSEGNFFKPSVVFFLNDGEKVVLEKAVDYDICEYLRKVAGKKEIKRKK